MDLSIFVQWNASEKVKHSGRDHSHTLLWTEPYAGAKKKAPALLYPLNTAINLVMTVIETITTNQNTHLKS